MGHDVFVLSIVPRQPSITVYSAGLLDILHTNQQPYCWLFRNLAITSGWYWVVTIPIIYGPCCIGFTIPKRWLNPLGNFWEIPAEAAGTVSPRPHHLEQPSRGPWLLGVLWDDHVVKFRFKVGHVPLYDNMYLYIYIYIYIYEKNVVYT